MSAQSCPVSGQSGSVCPSGRMGPRGCAFSGFQPNSGAITYYPDVRYINNEVLGHGANDSRIMKTQARFTTKNAGL